MKNRPVASAANQIKDVYSTQKKSTFTTLSAALTVIVFIIALIAVIMGNNLMMVIFIPLFVLLLISFLVARRADRQNTPVAPENHPDAIFKEHEI